MLDGGKADWPAGILPASCCQTTDGVAALLRDSSALPRAPCPSVYENARPEVAHLSTHIHLTDPCITCVHNHINAHPLPLSPQGMNELIAPLYYLFKNDPDPLAQKYAEADAFW